MNAQVLVHQAAVWNRDGIAAVACGNGEKAHFCFRRALEIMGHLTQAPDLLEATMAAVVSVEDVLSPIAVPSLQSERFYIYNCAMMFSPSPNADHQYSQTDATLFSAAAVFNMALTYHQRALFKSGGSRSNGRSSRSSTQHGAFRTAGRMYDQCLHILNSLPPPPAATNQQEVVWDPVSLLRLVVANNRSHIYYELQDFEKAQMTLERVRALSRYIAHTSALRRSLAKPTTFSLLQENSFDEIALNVLVTSRPNTAPCA